MSFKALHDLVLYYSLLCLHLSSHVGLLTVHQAPQQTPPQGLYKGFCMRMQHSSPKYLYGQPFHPLLNQPLPSIIRSPHSGKPFSSSRAHVTF